MFSGVLECADCHSKLYYCTSRNFASNQDHFVCSNYKSNTGTCSAHFIREQALNTVVFKHINRVLRYVQQFEATFVRSMYKKSFEDRRAEIAEMKKNLIKANRRIDELNKLFKRIYEDRAASRLSDERYQLLSDDYETEQQQLKLDVMRMEADVAKGEEVTADFERFLANVRKHTDFEKLTPTIVNEFISKIIIHAPDKSSGKREQQIDIHYTALGIIDIPTEDELDAMEAEYRAQQQHSHKSA